MARMRLARPRLRGFAAFALVMLGGRALEVRATTLIVPDQYATIQAAIDAAAGEFPGDTVQVRPGTYPEALLIQDKYLTIEGLGGKPVIAPGAEARGVFARGDVAVTLRDLSIDSARVGIISRVYALTLTAVDVVDCGKGAIVKGFSVIIDGSTFTGSTRGTGLKAGGTVLDFDGVIASGNMGTGANIKSKGTAVAMVSNSTFDDNGKHGLMSVNNWEVEISACGASRNAGAGIVLKAKTPEAVDPMLTDNRADDNGTYGFHLRGALGSLTEAGLLASGNTATGNGVQDFLLQPS